MSFWDKQMPRGMLLRSPYVASNIADPERALTLDAYGEQTRRGLPKPVTLEQFVGYGRWFRDQALPQPQFDRRNVSRLEQANGHFRLELADGERLRAHRVVVAAGIMPFASCRSRSGNCPRSSSRTARPSSGTSAFSAAGE